MKLKWIGQYHGPNPFNGEPVVTAALALEGKVTYAAAARAANLLYDAFPHGEPVSAGATGLMDADDGLLLLAQAAAAWSLGVLNAVRGNLHAFGAKRTADHVYVWVGFHQAALSRKVLSLALQYIWKALDGQDGAALLKKSLPDLLQACRRAHPDYQARILMVGARRQDIPFLSFLPGSRYWQFGWGAKSRVFFESSSNKDGYLGWKWQRNKAVTKSIMNALGIPTPSFLPVAQENDLEAAVGQIGFPCVIKPPDCSGGKGVTANIADLDSLRAAFKHARSFSSEALLLEKHLIGHDHRLMVINGKFVGAIRREPSCVIGDGRRTVAELVAELNSSRSSNMIKSRYLRPIPQDDVLRRHLATQDADLSQVLASGRRLSLRSNANLSTGGICIDVTGHTHPQVRAMAEQLASACGLAMAGLDYMTVDISKAPAESGGAFIEMNTSPGLDACIAAGWSEEAIGALALGDDLGRIPVSMTVVNAEIMKDKIAALDGSILADDDGWACGDVFQIGQLRLQVAQSEPWAAIKAALRNRRLHRLHVVCSSEEIQRHGLPLDRFDQANVLDDGLAGLWLKVIESSSSRLVR